MSSEKVLVIIEMDGTFIDLTAGDFVDVRVINWAAIRGDGGLRCPECGHDEAEPDMTTASDVWICDACDHKFERNPDNPPVIEPPGAEYIEAFNAHVMARSANEAFPFTIYGTGRPARLLEMIRSHSMVERYLPDSDGLQITLQYHVDTSVGRDVYCASWTSAVRSFWKFYRRCQEPTDEVSAYLDVWTPDERIATICMLSFFRGEVGLYYNHMRGLVEPPQP